MKTKLILIFVLLLGTSFFGFNQTATSVANGNWLNPTTWSPVGIPLPGYTITINHHVTLDTNFFVPSGSITVTASGFLDDDVHGRSLLINGGTVTNNGKTEMRLIYTQSGNFTNNDSLHVTVFANNITFLNNGKIYGTDSLYTSGQFNNYGHIDATAIFNANIFNNHGVIVADSATSQVTFTNYSGAIFDADSLTNFGVFTNEGIMQHFDFTNTGTYTNSNYIGFTDFTNIGTFINNDSLIGIGSFTNLGYFKNNASGVMSLDDSFLNTDTLGYIGIYENEGLVFVGNNWYNDDTVKGVAGYFIVQNLSGNSGFMKGSFDFCDLTPPSTSPYIDYNSGTISLGITWCTNDAIKKNEGVNNISFFPNPTNGIVMISLINNAAYVKIFNVTGDIVYNNKISRTIDISNYSNGIYLLQVYDEKNILLKQSLIVKQ
ncbi:MAG: T9SS type A sorting domain-containing protein [Bacteroidia bacterium]|nr:T9SS type A sorting domain-containing protein [Bacteroidia bacterium]